MIEAHTATPSESTIRRTAHRMGYRVEKSRQQQHLNNRGEYMLIDDRNCVVAGSNYDMPLSEIWAALNE